LVIHLKPRSTRQAMVTEVIEQIRPQLEHIPGMKVYLQNPPTVRIGGQVTKSLYQFSLVAPIKKELYEYAVKLEDEVRKIPGLSDVTSDMATQSPQVNVTIDRDRAAAMQVNAQQIERLYDAYGPRWISTIYASINSTRYCWNSSGISG
jgi:HAE1 family hydrophobic/amphiphilic exporter-1